MRLFDLADDEAVRVECVCGRSVEYPPSLLQRRHRLPSDTLLYDLQFRLRCKRCNRIGGFTISVIGPHTGDSSIPMPIRRIVGPRGEPG